MTEQNKTCIELFNDAALNQPKTVICGGVPRGGTSMVAGAIHGLGVSMGSNLPDNIEDPLFNIDVATRSGLKRGAFLTKVNETVAQRTADKKSWGWKFPRVSSYLWDVIDGVENPHLVMVLRDAVPAGLRAAPQIQKDKNYSKTILKHLNGQLREAQVNMDMISALRLPTLIVSYERSTRSPEVFVSELASFLGVALPSDLTALLDFMTPGSYKAPPTA
jgi:hypothetical protein